MPAGTLPHACGDPVSQPSQLLMRRRRRADPAPRHVRAVVLQSRLSWDNPLEEDDMTPVFVVDACRTPIGKVKGALAGVRPDHLAADVIKALLGRNPGLDVAAIDDVWWGAANQAGEDNRNVARMAVLLAGLPVEIPGATVNRLCGSGMEAVADAARAIAAGEADICLAGGSESMTRAPFVIARSADPFPRGLDLVDTRLGWGPVGARMPGLCPPTTLGERAEAGGGQDS